MHEVSNSFPRVKYPPASPGPWAQACYLKWCAHIRPFGADSEAPCGYGVSSDLFSGYSSQQECHGNQQVS
jgi:hypothetical protein